MTDMPDPMPPASSPWTAAWPQPAGTYDLRGNCGPEPPSQAIYHAVAAARGYRATESQRRTVSEESTDSVRAAATAMLFEAHTEHEETLVLGWGTCCVHLSLESSATANPWLSVHVAGPDIQAVRGALGDLKELLPTALSDEDEELVEIRFWMGGAYNHAARVDRRLAAPRWTEVSANYPADTRRDLEVAMSDLEGLAQRGRVLLWHGPPGTGKTYAVRALAREHSHVATVDCIVEPELFFSRGARYLTEVLDVDDDPDDERWHVLVVEDADELISADAKMRSGQGLSRLLNLADGLFGQAIRVLVLVTTNEPMTSFHPALVRPGRCGSLVSFQRFGAGEAQHWLRRAGSSEAVGGPATLAELFAMTSGLAPVRGGKEVGFHLPTPAERLSRSADGPAMPAVRRRSDPGSISDEEAERPAHMAERPGPEDVMRVRPDPAARRRGRPR